MGMFDRDKGQGVKKLNADGTINKKWLEIHGHTLRKGKRSSRKQIRPMAGNIDRSYDSPMQDWAETSDDL